MRPGLGRVWQAAAIFVLVLVAGLVAPWSGRLFIVGYCALANVALRTMDYDGRVSARLRPAPDSERRVNDQVKTDATLDMRAMDYHGVQRIGVSLRRDVYAPMVLTWALLLAAPMTRPGRISSLCIATAVVLVVGVFSSCALVELVVMNDASKTYVPSGLKRSMAEFVLERWLTPPGNRIIAPLLLAGVLIGHSWPQARGSRPTPPAPLDQGRHQAEQEEAR